jgi:hypothetical protein
VIKIASEVSIAGGEKCGAHTVWQGAFVGDLNNDPRSLADFATLLDVILVDLRKLYAVTMPIHGLFGRVDLDCSCEPARIDRLETPSCLDGDDRPDPRT